MRTPALIVSLLLALAPWTLSCGPEESDCEQALALQLGAVQDFCTANRTRCKICDCWLRDQIVGLDGECESPPACEDDPATPEDECQPGDEEICGVNQRYQAQLCLKSQSRCRGEATDAAEALCALEWLMEPCVSSTDCLFGTTCQDLGGEWFCLNPL